MLDVRMELRDIEYFAVVAEQRHLGRAAEALGLSQPALSKSLKRLELSLQVKLVRRTPKGTELTAEGYALLGRVQELRLAFQSVAREISDVSRGRVGHLRIGAGAAVSQHFLSESFAALLEQFPRARLKAVVSDNDVMIPALRNGELDLIINYVMQQLPEELVSEYLFEEDQLVCASTKHRLAGKSQVTIDDLDQERWAMNEPALESSIWLQGQFRERGLGPPKITFESRSAVLRLQTVASSKLLAFAPRSAIESAKSSGLSLTSLDVKELTRTRQIGIAFRREAYMPPILNQFIKILKEKSAGKPFPRKHR
jgi:DNA-binding transcriptional LysR family regulator